MNDALNSNEKLKASPSNSPPDSKASNRVKNQSLNKTTPLVDEHVRL
jgi:hypothetical protein